ncbi:MAG: hypothetical protein JWN10_2432 [Solirubrobacterales bacterium]|nr:hypothetical protein [Solirubrobacterales bacterium]
MPEDCGHAAAVDAWVKRVGAAESPQLVPLLGRALGAIWTRANDVLGEVTLMAIFQRVILLGRNRFPVLVAIKLEARDAPFGELNTRTLARSTELVDAVRFVLTELLTVFASLTGGVLNVPLRAALDAIDEPAT